MDQNNNSPRSGVSETLRSVARDLHEGSPQEKSVAQAIDSLADASDALRSQDPNDAIVAVDTFARRNPLVFMGAAALAGFAATRLIKATAPEDPSQSEVTRSEDLV